MFNMKIELVLPELQPVILDPSDTVLVVVDMQNEYLKPEGTYYMGTRSEQAVNKLASLLEKFREGHSKVVFVHSLRAAAASEFTIYRQSPYIVEGTWGAEIVDELKPLTRESVVRKRSNDCFNHTRMEEVLSALDVVPGRSQVVVTGCATNGCVDCAVVGFSVRGYQVVVPEDCTTSHSEEAEMFGYAHFFGKGYLGSATPTRSDLITIEERVSTSTMG
jgi:nicotinamidase-related amidase